MTTTDAVVIDVIKRVAKVDSEALLFFIGDSVSRGMLSSYAHIGQHSEASWEYYTQDTRAPASEHEQRQCERLLEEWRDMPDPVEYRVAKRINAKKLSDSWT